MDLKQGFEEATKELKAFTQAEIEYYEGQGQSVDRESHTNHLYRVFVLGKLKVLEERITKLETMGAKNVKTTKRKTTSKKASSGTDEQLELEL